MKEKILTFITGVLVGAIIATTGFLIYNKIGANNSNQPEMMQMDGNGPIGGQQPGSMEEPPEKPDGDNGEEPPEKPDGDNGEEPPEKPDGDNGEQPPTKPEEANNNTSN